MNRRYKEAACIGLMAMLALVPSLQGQAAPAVDASAPRITGYDAVSIKPNNTGSGNVSIQTDADSFKAENVPVMNLIGFAYNMRTDQLSGEPAWAQAQHYDIIAKITDADAAALRALTPAERRQFMQAMLAERFHLKAHVEPRTLPVYELTVTKGGPKFKAAAAADEEKPVNGVGAGGTMINNGHLAAHDITMQSFAETLSNQLQRSVLDKTGLAAKYDLQLTWTREEMAGTADAIAPPLFTALQEQLGLKLQSTKGPVDTLVIDHLDKPSED